MWDRRKTRQNDCSPWDWVMVTAKVKIFFFLQRMTRRQSKEFLNSCEESGIIHNNRFLFVSLKVKSQKNQICCHLNISSCLLLSTYNLKYSSKCTIPSCCQGQDWLKHLNSSVSQSEIHEKRLHNIPPGKQIPIQMLHEPRRKVKSFSKVLHWEWWQVIKQKSTVTGLLN